MIAVLFFSTHDRRNLTAMRWLETIDNDLTGDSGWREEHLVGADPLSTINRIRWLWRNGGNALNYQLFGCADALYWRMTASLKPFMKRPDGYWLYRRFFRLTNQVWLEVFMGWALLGPQQGRCKYVCTIRLRSKPS